MIDWGYTFDRVSVLFHSMKMGGVGSVVSAVASSFMIFGGVIPYLPQYKEISASSNADGFSLYVCLTLLIANILRIMFWFGHPFELPLLLQSIIMITAMLAMVQLCTSVKRKSEIIASKTRQFTGNNNENGQEESSSYNVSVGRQHTFTEFDWRYFWQWSDFFSYVQFILFFTLIVGVVTVLLLNVSIYVEMLGLLALLCEALLGAPQFYRNLRNKSTKGMSLWMVMLWASGDIFKTVYFIARAAPVQFWICGILQISLDFAILLQVSFYGDKTTTQ